jgi:hypothetical protein
MHLSRALSLAATTIAIATIATPTSAAVGLEVALAPGYGSAGAKSPVLYKPTGLVQMAPGTVSSIWDGSAQPYRAGIVLEGAIGYRPLPFLSFGLTGGWRQSQVSSADVQGPLSNIGRSGLEAGLYARGYLPLVGRLVGLDPWFSLGISYVYDKQTYDQVVTVNGLGDVSMPFSLTHHGVGIPLTIGVDYRVLPILAIGPSFRYEPVVGVAGCVSTNPTQSNLIGTSYCSTADSRQRVTAAESYGVWSLGLELRLEL